MKGYPGNNRVNDYAGIRVRIRRGLRFLHLRLFSAGNQGQKGQEVQKGPHSAYSRLKMNTQLMAATIPIICGTVGTAA